MLLVFAAKLLLVYALEPLAVNISGDVNGVGVNQAEAKKRVAQIY